MDSYPKIVEIPNNLSSKVVDEWICTGEKQENIVELRPLSWCQYESLTNVQRSYIQDNPSLQKNTCMVYALVEFILYGMTDPCKSLL